VPGDDPGGREGRVGAGGTAFGPARGTVPVRGTAEALRAAPSRGAKDRAGFGTGRPGGAFARADPDIGVPGGAGGGFAAVPPGRARVGFG